MNKALCNVKLECEDCDNTRHFERGEDIPQIKCPKCGGRAIITSLDTLVNKDVRISNPYV